MFTLVDKYIIKKYFTTLLFVMLVFTLISVIIDFADKFEDFYEEDITKWQIINEFYLNFIPFINSMLLPIYILISVIFFTSRMASNLEILAILNAGVSYNRLMRPFLICSIVVAGLNLVSNNYWLPLRNAERLEFEHKYIWKYDDQGKKNMVHMFVNENDALFIKNFFDKDTMAKNIRIEHYEDDKITQIITAEKAKFVSKGKWSLTKYVKRNIVSDKNQSIEVERKKELVIDLDLSINDFVRYEEGKDMLTTPQIKEFIKKEKIRGLAKTDNYQLEIYSRNATPFSIIILTLIGFALAGRKVRGGIGLHLAMGLLTGAIYIFLGKFSQTFALNYGINPMLGVWLPNIFFGLFAAYLLSKAQK